MKCKFCNNLCDKSLINTYIYGGNVIVYYCYDCIVQYYPHVTNFPRFVNGEEFYLQCYNSFNIGETAVRIYKINSPEIIIELSSPIPNLSPTNAECKIKLCLTFL